MTQIGLKTLLPEDRLQAWPVDSDSIPPARIEHGEHDWSQNSEREETMKLLGLNTFEVMKDTGHFSFLESPMKVAELIKA